MEDPWLQLKAEATIQILQPLLEKVLSVPATSYKEPRIMLSLYKTLVRPHVEYCSSVWNPYYSKDKELLERVPVRTVRVRTVQVKTVRQKRSGKNGSAEKTVLPLMVCAVIRVRLTSYHL